MGSEVEQVAQLMELTVIFCYQVLMESTNGGRGGGAVGATNGTNGDSHAINGVENGRAIAQV